MVISVVCRHFFSCFVRPLVRYFFMCFSVFVRYFFRYDVLYFFTSLFSFSCFRYGYMYAGRYLFLSLWCCLFYLPVLSGFPSVAMSFLISFIMYAVLSFFLSLFLYSVISFGTSFFLRFVLYCSFVSSFFLYLVIS